MKGLRLPSGDLHLQHTSSGPDYLGRVVHLSDKLPRMGVRRKPTSGDRHQISVMWDCDTPDMRHRDILTS